MCNKISVIIPAFKVEKYLSKCVESVLNQTYSDLEIILVDDGSPDNCGSICESFKEKDCRVKVIHKQNGGLSDARNVGMSIATGDYISFIDSDDWVEKDYFQVLINLLTENNADLASVSLSSVREDDQEVGRKHTGEVFLFGASEAMCSMFSRNGIPWCAQAKLYKKNLFDGIKFPCGQLMEDKATTYKVFAKCNRIVYADLPCYKYLVRQESIMHSEFSEKRLNSFAIQEELNSFIEHNFPEAVTLTHAYTVKVSIAFLCLMSESGFDKDNKDKCEHFFEYINRFKKEFFSSKIIDWRFKFVGKFICLMRWICGEKVYFSVMYRLICKKAAIVISTK